MPLITLTGAETPAENVGKSVNPQTLDTFLRERKIGPGSEIYLEAFVTPKMKRQKVFQGTATEAATINLDPGWYRYKVTWIDEYKERHQFVNQFFVQITYDMFRRYAVMEPKDSKARQTSEGTRWFCGHVGCKRSFTSKHAIIDHEKRHEGVTIFKDVPWEPEVDAEGRLSSRGIVILGGAPEGASKPEPRKAVLPPTALMDQIEAESAHAPVKRKRGRPRKVRVEAAQAHV